MTNNEINQLIELIAAECKCSKEEAQENLNGSITYLQELKLEGDLRLRDIKEECSGLLGVTVNNIFEKYVSVMTQEENIPDYLKKKHNHDEDEEFYDNSDFNPYDFLDCFGEEMCQEIMEMIA